MADEAEDAVVVVFRLKKTKPKPKQNDYGKSHGDGESVGCMRYSASWR